MPISLSALIRGANTGLTAASRGKRLGQEDRYVAEERERRRTRQSDQDAMEREAAERDAMMSTLRQDLLRSEAERNRRPVAPRNMDPLSPEGIEAAATKARRIGETGYTASGNRPTRPRAPTTRPTDAQTQENRIRQRAQAMRRADPDLSWARAVMQARTEYGSLPTDATPTAPALTVPPPRRREPGLDPEPRASRVPQSRSVDRDTANEGQGAMTVTADTFEDILANPEPGFTAQQWSAWVRARYTVRR